MIKNLINTFAESAFFSKIKQMHRQTHKLKIYILFAENTMFTEQNPALQFCFHIGKLTASLLKRFNFGFLIIPLRFPLDFNIIQKLSTYSGS